MGAEAECRKLLRQCGMPLGIFTASFASSGPPGWALSLFPRTRASIGAPVSLGSPTARQIASAARLSRIPTIQNPTSERNVQVPVRI